MCTRSHQIVVHLGQMTHWRAHVGLHLVVQMVLDADQQPGNDFQKVAENLEHDQRQNGTADRYQAFQLSGICNWYNASTVIQCHL